MRVFLCTPSAVAGDKAIKDAAKKTYKKGVGESHLKTNL